MPTMGPWVLAGVALLLLLVVGALAWEIQRERRGTKHAEGSRRAQTDPVATAAASSGDPLETRRNA